MSEQKRQPGYYWVNVHSSKLGESQEVAFWDGDGFLLRETVTPRGITGISETRIPTDVPALIVKVVDRSRNLQDGKTTELVVDLSGTDFTPDDIRKCVKDTLSVIR